MKKIKKEDVTMKQSEFGGKPVSTALRLDAELYKRIREEAFKRGVSVNYLLVETLQKVFGK